MKKTFSIGIFVSSFFLLLGCSAHQQLREQMTRLEIEVQDLRNSNQRMATQLGELRIQLSVIRHRLAPAAASKGAARNHMPSLRVVRLKPNRAIPLDPDEESLGIQEADVGRDEPVPMLTNQGKAGSIRHRLQRRRAPNASELDPVNPYAVHDRLSVDRVAAKRSLDEPLVVTSGADTGPDEAFGTEQPVPDFAPGNKAFGAAYAYYRVNDFDRAVEALDGFLRDHAQHPKAADAMFYLANARMMLGQVDRAEQKFLVLVDRFPRDTRAPEALFLAGRCQEKAGQATKAKGTYLQLVESYPRSAHAGEANRRLGLIR